MKFIASLLLISCILSCKEPTSPDRKFENKEKRPEVFSLNSQSDSTIRNINNDVFLDIYNDKGIRVSIYKIINDPSEYNPEKRFSNYNSYKFHFDYPLEKPVQKVYYVLGICEFNDSNNDRWNLRFDASYGSLYKATYLTVFLQRNNEIETQYHYLARENINEMFNDNSSIFSTSLLTRNNQKFNLTLRSSLH